MSTPFVGQISLFGFPFAPSGWAQCNGQLMAISQNQALFALIGTTYGGNGVQTFGLPDLRGRVPLHYGNGPGLSPYVIGQVAGVEQVALTQANLPAHSHSAALNVAAGTRGAVPAASNYLETNTTVPPSPAPTLVPLNPAGITVGLTGSNQSFPILQPYLAVNYCIALQGIFPSRN